MNKLCAGFHFGQVVATSTGGIFHDLGSRAELSNAA
jgi:hypothetical protein